MNTLKILAILTILGGAVTVALGTGAFAAINADRLADVGITSDDSALLGVTVEGGTVHPGGEVTLVTVTNNMGGAIDTMDVTVLDDGPFNNVVIQQVPESLPEGGSGPITATVAGPPSTAGDIEIRIVAESIDGTSVDLTREVYVELESPGLGLCTIENDDRIGERLLDVEEEFFDCTITIETHLYEVIFEESTVTGGFELSAGLLHSMTFEGSQVGGAVDIQLSQNANGDIDFETTSFGDDLSIDVEQVAQGITLESSTVDGTVDISSRNQNGDVELEASSIGGSAILTFDGPVSGTLETEDTQIGGNYEITVTDNLNDDIEIENANVGGDLHIVIEGNQNGDIEIDDSTIGGDLTIVVEGHSNGDIDLDGNSVGGTETVDADSSGGGLPGW